MFVRSLCFSAGPRAVARATSAHRQLLPCAHVLARPSRTYASAVSVNGFSQLKPTLYGQPLAPSHAHLVSTHETTPGIPQEEYDRRRRELMQSLPDGALVICGAGQIKYMSGRE